MPMGLQIKPFLTLCKRAQFPLQDQYKFLQQLKRLISNGYPLVDALEILKWEHSWTKQAATILVTLKQGLPFDQALNKANFDDKIVSFMFLSRSNGDLVQSLDQCCLMLTQQIKHMKNFQKTIRYPFMLFVLFIVLLYFVKTSVYPSFSRLFLTTSQSSSVTDISITLINSLFNGSTILISVLTLIFLLWVLIRNNLKIATKIKIYSHIPLIRSYKKWNTTFLFSIQMASLLKAGFSLKEALQTLEKQKQSSIISYYSHFIISELQQGKQVTSILPSCQLFESELSSLFAKSTNNQTLEKDLSVYASFIMERIQDKITKLITLIQPICFILLAGLIILVYLSLMLPMFQLIQSM